MRMVGQVQHAKINTLSKLNNEIKSSALDR